VNLGAGDHSPHCVAAAGQLLTMQERRLEPSCVWFIVYPAAHCVAQPVTVPASTPESAGGKRQSCMHVTQPRQPVGSPAALTPESPAHVHHDGAQQPSMH
jgi:hypothetical protein